ncbi:protein-disulfide reductase DsbD domain-containing protein [Lacibacter sediminis]|uniref:Sugar transporter n=1 Tax=Lacibacter sediminis TaxID=2760713 RepID=A0A7G5XKH2_9BACT|nr:protein-disulfide reductase DsbD domain-containing protein [Lacibacter sediminis]QNA45975.1 sugar transporter [Lacibacter sediminis]
MRKTAVLLVLLLSGFFADAQIQNPVKWSYTLKKVNATTYEVHITATIEKGWHLYSQTTPEGGPIPTTINFSKNPLVTLVGTAKEEGKLEQRHEKLFGVDVKQFSNTVKFVQAIKVKAKVKTAVTGIVEFMVCNDSQCLPPTSNKFSLPIQ